MKSRVCSGLLKTLTIDMGKYYAYPLPAFVTNQLTLKSQFVFTLATMFLSLLIFAAPRFSSFYPMPLLQLNQNLRPLRKWVLHQTAFRPESSEIRQWTGSGDWRLSTLQHRDTGDWSGFVVTLWLLRQTLTQNRDQAHPWQSGQDVWKIASRGY